MELQLLWTKDWCSGMDQEIHSSCSLCMEAANETPGIAHVYTTLTTLWKHFHKRRCRVFLNFQK